MTGVLIQRFKDSKKPVSGAQMAVTGGKNGTKNSRNYVNVRDRLISLDQPSSVKPPRI